ncbi:hypothetical protein RHEC894_PC00106 (plasmid) [Rhizobium sp. CIAT894]|nr:hypothetical protein RHEC894_PC00106 [Rhizobium sp. CIAT894]
MRSRKAAYRRAAGGPLLCDEPPPTKRISISLRLPSPPMMCAKNKENGIDRASMTIAHRAKRLMVYH